jgi:hypothetical protein
MTTAKIHEKFHEKEIKTWRFGPVFPSLGLIHDTGIDNTPRQRAGTMPFEPISKDNKLLQLRELLFILLGNKGGGS